MLWGLLCALAGTACGSAAPGETEFYYLVFLKRAPDRKPISEAEGERIQTAHMANIHAMADRGVLVAAGPFEDSPAVFSGVFVFRAGSVEEARRIAEQDPTVVEHRNLVEVYAWRGPKGIGDEYKRLHQADPKTPEGMGVHPFAVLYRGSGWDDGAARAHTAYLEKLRGMGKLAAAGEIEGDRERAGLVILERIPDEEAKRLLEDDPAVRGGALRLEYHRWWCAAHVMPR